MKTTMKVSLISATLLFASSSVFALSPNISASQLPKLTAQPEHALASQRVATRFQRSHYKQFSLDDNFSKGIFQRYLDALDYNRSIFTQSDIAQLRQYETIIDDELKSGKTTAAFAMYNLSIQRRYQFYSYALTLLDSEIKFDTNEEMVIDRSEMNWPATTEELQNYWRQRVKYDALNLKLDGNDWAEIKDLLTRRYNNAIKRLTQTKSEDVFQVYMNAFAREIDPHTSYLSPRSADEFQEQMNLSLEGIGAVLQADEDYTVIHELVVGGPAYNSKQLQEEDKIIGVGQEGGEMVDIIGMRLDDVVDLIKGPKGTKVYLQIQPAEKGMKSHVVTIVRDEVRLEDRAAKLEFEQQGDKKIAVIDIPGFYSGLTKDTLQLLKQIDDSKDVDGLVIDLRNNGGGALTEAIGLSGLFISKGPVVQVRDGYDRVNVDRDSDGYQYYSGPMVVLINRYSASASEIFAAAMQDYNRAVIVGENSFGKGTVQQHRDLARIYDLSEENLGFVQYTIQKFYRINGGSTQLKGVIPDIAFPTEIAPEDTGESMEDNALEWDQISRASYTEVKDSNFMQDLVARLTRSHNARIAKDREFNYIKQDIARYKQEESKNTISLNEKVRQVEIKEMDDLRLSRVNARRQLEGKAPYKTVEDIPKDYEGPDAYLDEAVAIVAEMQ